MARGIWRQDQSRLPYARQAAQCPDTSAAIPTTLYCNSPASPGLQILPSAICPPTIQTAGTRFSSGLAAAASQYRRTPSAPPRFNRSSLDILACIKAYLYLPQPDDNHL